MIRGSVSIIHSLRVSHMHFSSIYYILTDADGGALELFPVVQPIESETGKVFDHILVTTYMILLNTENAVAVPSALPSASILPLFNTMMLFAVQPGVSYHAVQEVFATGKPRLSIRFQVTTTVRMYVAVNCVR